MSLSVEFRNRLLNGIGVDTAVSASLHSTENEPDDGSGEISGGSYSRQAITWANAADGTATLAEAVTFNVPAEVTVYWVGLWDTDGVWLGALRTSTDEYFAGPGTLTVDPGAIALVNQS
ncbi:hypothetical protein RIF23_05190 [Lipingzhangella sp. LS1_29]|uniref:Uncharacterized protein n=1 Tax=Lipingzhangella rawalii TaxID=2055835 RepID=A0ABU2H305_9ACTN|nr:hypothetical protein [Lipingzhangella rawalii]MDS1269684.1 hypothetical protein [Lipingzhangella rawalii]